MDINKASKAELETLPGIGDHRALCIIKARAEAGGISTPEDFMSIIDIPAKVWNKLMGEKWIVF